MIARWAIAPLHHPLNHYAVTGGALRRVLVGREPSLEPNGIKVPRWKFIHKRVKEDSVCRIQFMGWIWQNG